MTKFRHLLLAAASAMVIASMTPAYADQNSNFDQKYVGDKVGQISAMPTTGMEATDIIGARVLSADNEDVGAINNLIVAKTGEIHGVVIGVGGFLGAGEKDVVVPMERLEITKRDGSFVVVLNATKEELKAATAYDNKEWLAYSYNDMSEQPATSDQQAQGSEQSTAGADQSTATTDQSTAETDQSATTNQQAQGSEQSTATTDQSTAETDQSAQSIDQSATTNQQAQIGQVNIDGKSVFEASNFIGKTVYSASDENVGDINDILFSADGEMIGLVVGVGGFLGLGEKHVLVPLDRFSISVVDADSYKIVINTTKAELEAAAAFDAVVLKPAS
jgi:sporulation protein YlmC with PRC-barrel domain